MTNDARKRFTLRVPAVLMEQVDRMAIKTGVSTNALILQILWNWLEGRQE